MTPFEAALAKGNEAARATNGEPLLITPAKKANRWNSAVADTDRATRTVTGIFLEGPGRTEITDNEIGRELNSRFAVAPVVALIDDTELLVGAAVVLPLAGDRVNRSSKPGSPTYEITLCEPTGGMKQALRLVRVDP